jgi:hypothetical protein
MAAWSAGEWLADWAAGKLVDAPEDDLRALADVLPGHLHVHYRDEDAS